MKNKKEKYNGINMFGDPLRNMNTFNNIMGGGMISEDVDKPLDYEIIISGEEYSATDDGIDYPEQNMQEKEEQILIDNDIDLDEILCKYTDIDGNVKYSIDSYLTALDYVVAKDAPDFVKFSDGKLGYVGEYGEQVKFITSDPDKLKKAEEWLESDEYNYYYIIVDSDNGLYDNIKNGMYLADDVTNNEPYYTFTTNKSEAKRFNDYDDAYYEMTEVVDAYSTEDGRSLDLLVQQTDNPFEKPEFLESVKKNYVDKNKYKEFLNKWKRLSKLVGEYFDNVDNEDTIDEQNQLIIDIEDMLPFATQGEHDYWSDVCATYKFWEDFEDLTLMIASRLKGADVKPIEYHYDYVDNKKIRKSPNKNELPQVVEESKNYEKGQKIDLSKYETSFLKKLAKGGRWLSRDEKADFNYATKIEPTGTVMEQTDKGLLVSVTYYRWNKERTDKVKKMTKIWIPKAQLKESVNYNELLKDAYKILDNANIRFDVEGTTFEFVDDDDAENAWKLLAKAYGKNRTTKKGLFKVELNLDESIKEAKDKPNVEEFIIDKQFYDRVNEINNAEHNESMSKLVAKFDDGCYVYFDAFDDRDGGYCQFVLYDKDGYELAFTEPLYEDEIVDDFELDEKHILNVHFKDEELNNLKEAKDKDTLYLVRTKSGVFEVRAKNDDQAVKQARIMQDEPVERVVNTTTNKVVFNLDENLQEAKNNIPEKANLKKILDRYNSNGKFAKQGSWKIARGGYDLAFQLYYNDLALIDGINDGFSNNTTLELDQDTYGANDEYSVKDLANYICQVYTDCKLDESLKEDFEDYYKDSVKYAVVYRNREDDSLIDAKVYDTREKAMAVLNSEYAKRNLSPKIEIDIEEVTPESNLWENLKESSIPVKDLLAMTDNKYDITLDHAIDDIKRSKGYNDSLLGDNYSIQLLMKRYGLEKRDIIRALNYKFDGKELEESTLDDYSNKWSKKAKEQVVGSQPTKFTVDGYYDDKYRGLANSETFDDPDKAFEYVWDLLQKGNYVRVNNFHKLSPDDVQEPEDIPSEWFMESLKESNNVSIDKVKEVVDKYDNSVYLEDEGYVSCANRKEMLAIAKELNIDDNHYGGNPADGYFIDINKTDDLDESKDKSTKGNVEAIYDPKHNKITYKLGDKEFITKFWDEAGWKDGAFEPFYNFLKAAGIKEDELEDIKKGVEDGSLTTPDVVEDLFGKDTTKFVSELGDPIIEESLNESSVTLKQENVGKFNVEYRWDKGYQGGYYSVGVYEKGPNDVYKTVVKKEYATKEDAKKAFDRYLKLVKQGKYGSIDESLDIDNIRKNLNNYSLDELRDIFTDIINETEGLDEDDPRAVDLSDLYNEVDNAINKKKVNESRHTYKDCDGDIQVYNDWGVEYKETYKNAVIVYDEDRDKYTIWSTNSNRPLSRIGRNNQYEPIYFNSIEEVKKYVDKDNTNESLNENSELFNFSKPDILKIRKWWRDVDDYYNNSIDLDTLDDPEVIDDWFITMWDVLIDLKKDNSEEAKKLLRRGKSIYNKYSISQFNESVSVKKN